MREHKYRAWHEKQGEYITGFFIRENNQRENVFQSYENVVDDMSCSDVNEDVILEEYTGHKNWYENDIIRSNHFISKGKTHYIEHQIVWSDRYCGWFMKNTTTEDIEAAGNIQMFVYLRSAIKPVLIGNIHEVKS